MESNSKMYIACLVLFSSVILCRGEVFTALSDCEPLLETHKRIIDDLDDYVQKEEGRITVLKRHLETYRREHEKAMDDIPNYLGNPLNAFTLIKRLTTDLDDIEQRIKIGTDYIRNMTVNHEDVKYPTIEDLAGAAHALTRLQKTYKLEVTELSEGLLNRVQYSSSMTAGDCFELGRALYNDKDFKNALPWLLEAHRKYLEERAAEINGYFFTDVDILDYISFAHYLLDDVPGALKWTKALLEVDPSHSRARSNVPHYEKMIAEENARLRNHRRGALVTPLTMNEKRLELEAKKQAGEQREETGHKNDGVKPKGILPKMVIDRNNYESMCRGEIDIPYGIKKRLSCFYTTDTHPFLKLARVKTEQRYIDPDVFIFYDVMSDDEIEYIKTNARPRFKRAVVHDPKSGELVPAHYRISKSAWLNDQEAEVIARVSRRVSHLTGLSMDTAEELQVVNYGIGGHYEPHYDFARKTENAFKERYHGNRIATVLFYMSEVAQGGATVFTELGLSVFPVKNAALFWMNLHPSGEGDLSTRHAACPVLRGSKWVSNKWIHQGGQELLKPCSLEYQPEEMVRKIPRPVPKSFR